MSNYYVERIKSEAEYLVENGATVRDAALVFGIGKSTVHKDVTVRLKRVDEKLFLKVRKVLDKNLEERHIRGGDATKRKYLQKKRSNILL